MLSRLKDNGSHLRVNRCVLTCVMITALVLGLACQPDETNTNSRPARNSSKASSGITNQKFLSSLPSGFKLPEQSDEVGMRVLSDYGAMFVARGGAVPPPAVIFENEAAVNEWQSSVKTTRAEMGGISVELQAPAMTALMEARDEARQDNLSITPRGTDAARRSYANTVKLWQSRVNSGLAHWTEEGSLTKDEAARIRALSPQEQIPEILRLEEEGLYFSTDFSKSILYSVAAPGTSQHLSMLAFDVKEYDNANIRSILASHGWFQTITSDLPHFTFLGVTEDELPSLGLKKVTNSGRTFWVPDLN